MHNVGSIFRTCDAFAVEEIILCGITGTPPHREIEKTALGATQSVKWQHFEENASAIKYLRENNWELIAIEQVANSTALNFFKPLAEKKYALVFGNEVSGVSEEVISNASLCVEIPQFGTKHSFNIVISAGIVLWDFYAKLNLNYSSNGN
jgi:tRNA G18 (ribose-2'-O)-methylase SpoU